MFSLLSSRLALKSPSTAGVTAVSQPVSMEGANAAMSDLTVYNITAGGAVTLSVNIQTSNDLENWTTPTQTALTATAEGHSTSVVESDIGAAYVRLEYSLDAGSAGEFAVISAGLSVFSN